MIAIQRQDGYVLVASMLAVALLFTGSVAVLSRITTEEKLTARSNDFEQAWYAAVAGMEDCLGYLRWDPEGQAAMASPASGAVVCSKQYTLGRISYQATVTAASARQVKVLATGSAGASTRTLGAIVRYSLGHGAGTPSWGGGNLWFDGGGTLEGEVFSATEIRVNGTFTVCGNFYATGDAIRGNNVKNGDNCNVGFYSKYPFIQFPDFQVPALKEQAAIIYEGDHTPECPPAGLRAAECDGPTVGELVVHVRGKLTLGRTNGDELYYTGRVIYIADNGVEIKSKSVDRPRDALLQVVAAGVGTEIKVTSNGTIKGVYVAPEGTFSTPGLVTVHGLVFARDWNNSGTLHWIAESDSGVCLGSGCPAGRMSIVKMWEQ